MKYALLPLCENLARKKVIACSYIQDCLFLMFSLLSPEEQRHCSRSGVTADGRANAVNQHPPVEVRETAFHKARHCLCIRLAGRMGNIALAVIRQAVLRKLLHLLFNGFNDLLLWSVPSVRESTFLHNSHAATDKYSALCRQSLPFSSLCRP